MAWPTSAFPTALDTIVDKIDGVDYPIANDINGAYDCIEKIQAKLGINSSAVATSIDYLLKNAASVDPGHKHGTGSLSALDVDGTMAANSDAKVPSQKAVKTYVDALLPTGTKMYFYQDTAPTGWTIDGAVADVCLAVKGGANAFNVAGGSLAGTWTQPGHTHTGPSHTHTGPSHTHSMGSHTHTGPSHTHGLGSHVHDLGLHTHTGPNHNHTGPSHNHAVSGSTASTGLGGVAVTPSGATAVMPDHSHTINFSTGAGGTGATGAGGTGATGAAAGNTGAAAGSTGAEGTGATGASSGTTGAEGTGATGAEGSGATGSSATAATFRPYSAVGIIATKN